MLLQEFPDRFMIGDDQFVVPSSMQGSGRLAVQLSQKSTLTVTNTRTLLRALLPELARKIASENTSAFYKLGA